MEGLQPLKGQGERIGGIEQAHQGVAVFAADRGGILTGHDIVQQLNGPGISLAAAVSEAHGQNGKMPALTAGQEGLVIGDLLRLNGRAGEHPLQHLPVQALGLTVGGSFVDGQPAGQVFHKPHIAGIEGAVVFQHRQLGVFPVIEAHGTVETAEGQAGAGNALEPADILPVAGSGTQQGAGHELIALGGALTVGAEGILLSLRAVRLPAGASRPPGPPCPLWSRA